MTTARILLIIFCLQLFAFIFIPQPALAGCGNDIKVAVYIPVPGAGQDVVYKRGNDYCVRDLPAYINSLYRFTIGAAGIIAVVMIMIGGVIWLMSAGDAGKIGKAKEFIGNAVVGLILLLLAYTILSTISPKLIQLQVPGLEIETDVNAEPRPKMAKPTGCSWYGYGEHPGSGYYNAGYEDCSGSRPPNGSCWCQSLLSR